MLVNLVGNAVKFTETGSVEVLVSRDGEGAQRRMLQVSVSDTGIGILPDQLPQIFKPFIQADSSTTRKYGGTGLGLAICWRLVHMMGGTLNVASSPGQGSRFSFSLALEETSPPAPSEPQPGVLANESVLPDHSLRILVAEDNAINRKVISHMLQNLDYPPPDMAVNGLECLGAVMKQNYDLIFMDVQMPELDGFETTTRLRALGNHVWICALTAAAMPGDRQKCHDAGMNDYLTKPVTKDQIKQAIARCLASRKGG